MNQMLGLGLLLAAPLACGGTSAANGSKGDGAGQSGHESAGTGAAGGEASGGVGGAHGGAGSGGSGAASGTTGGGHSGAAGAGGTGGEAAGTGPGGSGGGGHAGASGSAQAGKGGSAGIGGASGAAGGNDAGAGGAAGAGGGKTCGGRTGTECDPGQYCKYESGMCGSFDETGTCTTQPGGIACVQGYACGCDGKVYLNLCLAHSNGVDVWSGNQCVPGDGQVGDACLTDDDCSSGLKCCSSPTQTVSCATPMGMGCPLTP